MSGFEVSMWAAASVGVVGLALFALGVFGIVAQRRTDRRALQRWRAGQAEAAHLPRSRGVEVWWP